MAYCDINTGLCLDPNDSAGATLESVTMGGSPLVTIWYATDPICSHCWALEPMWRKLLYHYGQHINARHLYGGLLPGWTGFADTGAGISSPADVAPHWAEVASYYGQPIDPSVWLSDPLSSSYPPSIALHAARMLDADLEVPFLRRLREALFLEARNIARLDVLRACAIDVGLDADAFVTLYQSGVAERAFRKEIEEVRALPVRGFPTLILQGRSDQAMIVHGTQPYQTLERALLDVTGLPRSTMTPSVKEALAAYKTGTTREFAELLNLDMPATVRALEGAGARRLSWSGEELWSIENTVATRGLVTEPA